MLRKLSVITVLAGLLAGFLVGCAQLPGERRQQAAVIGGVGGAAAGAAVGGERHRILGALIGGAVGAGGGYLIGAHLENLDDREAAEAAVQRAQARPATPEEALAATTADINQDGFVTLDEIVAMHQAGLGDQEMIRRLELTNQIFELTPEQRQHLLTRGVSPSVVNQLEFINQEQRDMVLQREVIGRQPLR